jgi:hypothetical protein
MTWIDFGCVNVPHAVHPSQRTIESVVYVERRLKWTRLSLGYPPVFQQNLQ